MRLPWIVSRFRRARRAGRSKHKTVMPLLVRRLERRRVLDASLAGIMVDLPINEGDTALATPIEPAGEGTLSYSWEAKQAGDVIATGFAETFSFVAPDDGTIEVNLTLGDSSEYSAFATTMFDAGSVKPTAILSNGGSVLEGSPGEVTFSEQFDPSAADTEAGFRYAYDFDNDGTFEVGDGTYGGSVNETSQVVPGSFLDDGYDTYTVRARIIDKDGGHNDYTTDISALNVNPAAAFANNGPIAEGLDAEVSFSDQFDPSAADTAAGFRYAYDFDNDGTFEVGDGTYGGSVTGASQTVPSSFVADGPGTYTVRGRILDQDGGYMDYTTDVEVFNVPPILANITGDTIDENEDATVSATIADSSSVEVFEVDVDWQDGTTDIITGLGNTDASGTVGGTEYAWTAVTRELRLSHQYLDDDPTGTPSDKYEVELTVRDDDLGSTGPYMATVTVRNVRPVLVVASDQTVNEGQELNLSAIGASPLGTFIDDGTLDTHTATIDWGDGSAIENATVFELDGSGSLGGTHTYADEGVYTVTVKITDDDGGMDTRMFEVAVNNVPPVLVVAADQTVNEGQGLDLSGISAPPLGTFIDDGVLDTHTATVDWGDGSMVENATVFQMAGSGALGGTHTYADDGVYTVTVTVTDDDGDSDSRMFEVTVKNVPPVLVVAADQTVNEGQELDLSGIGAPPLGTFIDDGVLDTHTATVDWGDGSMVENVTVFQMAGSGALGGTHTYADDGVYTVTVTVTDDDGDNDTRMFDVTVKNVPPVLVVAADQMVNEGEELDLSGVGAPPLGTFIDNGILDTHTATVDWGDGSMVENAMVFQGTGFGALGGTHTYADDGVYTVTVTVIDDDGDSDTRLFGVTVKNVPPVLVVAADQIVDEGQELDLSAIGAPPLGTFIDDGILDTHTATVNWGDGSPTENATVFEVDGSGAIGGTHTYADDGIYTVTVTVTDDDDGSDTRMFQVTVNNVNPMLEAIISPTTINEGEMVSFDAMFSDPGFDNPDNPNAAVPPLVNDPLNESFRYYVDWGDGRDQIADMMVADDDGAPGTPSTGMFDGSHTYADDGTYIVTIRIADDNMTGNFASGMADIDFVEFTFEVTVNNVNPMLDVTTSPTTINEGEMVNFDAMFSDPGFDNPDNPNAAVPPLVNDPLNESFHYYVDWGDGRDQIADMMVADDNGSPGTPSTGIFDGSHTYADNGTYTVTIRIADDNMTGNFAAGMVGVDFVEQTFLVTVNNVDPILIDIDNLEVNEGEAFTLRDLGVRLSDPGFDNLLNTDPTNGGETQETFTGMTIDWGDGVGVNEPVSIDNIADRTSGSPGVPTTAFFTHDAYTYADDGTYTVTISFQDDDGPVVMRQLQITVNNVAPELFVVEGMTPDDLTVDESEDLVLPMIARFTDQGFDNPNNPNGPEPPLINDPLTESFRYFIDWGDGRDQIGTMDVADMNGGVDVLSTGMFGAAHNYADNGLYTVTVRLADDNMTAFNTAQMFLDGMSDVDFVEATFTVTVNNVAPSFVPDVAGDDIQGDDIDNQGITTIYLDYTDLGYDNPLNTLDAANGGEVAETFTHVVDWSDGIVDAIHTYVADGVYTVTVTVTDSGGSQIFTFANFDSSLGTVLSLVSGQTLTDPTLPSEMVTFDIDWGDGAQNTITLELVQSLAPAINAGQTIIVENPRVSGDADILTMGSAAIQHEYEGPPDPFNPTADVRIFEFLMDDDGGVVSAFFDVSNPGIETQMVAIDTTPDVPRLELIQLPSTDAFVPPQSGSNQVLESPDVRRGGGQLTSASERYLQIHQVFPDGTLGPGFRIKDDALLDIRSFFSTLPDGHYEIYLVRSSVQTTGKPGRLVIGFDVRNGQVTDVSDDSAGGRDRPPTAEPPIDTPELLEENQFLERVPNENSFNDAVPSIDEATVDATPREPHVEQQTEELAKRRALSTWLPAGVSAGLIAAAAREPWSRRVDSALAMADDHCWQRLRRAGRRRRVSRTFNN